MPILRLPQVCDSDIMRKAWLLWFAVQKGLFNVTQLSKKAIVSKAWLFIRCNEKYIFNSAIDALITRLVSYLFFILFVLVMPIVHTFLLLLFLSDPVSTYLSSSFSCSSHVFCMSCSLSHLFSPMSLLLLVPSAKPNQTTLQISSPSSSSTLTFFVS